MAPRRQKITLARREVVTSILSTREDTLVVCGLGGTVWDAAAAGDNPANFYLWGGMGGAAMMGLGLALAQPQRSVLVITGDGEMLMGLGSLATIGVCKPSNLAIVVIDNELYGETGLQPTHTRHGVDLAGIAAASRFPHSKTVYTKTELATSQDQLFSSTGPVFVVIKVTDQLGRGVLPPRHGPYLKDRFRHALLGNGEKA